jgi:heterodisulfide reductase subunit A
METTAGQVGITIDGRSAVVAADTTILQAARQLGIAIPTLCHHRGLNPYGACRICLVEVDSPRGPKQVSSCNHPVSDGMVVRTDTNAVKEGRRTILELLLAKAPDSTELQALAKELGVEGTPFETAKEGKCILCGLCVRVCTAPAPWSAPPAPSRSIPSPNGAPSPTSPATIKA